MTPRAFNERGKFKKLFASVYTLTLIVAALAVSFCFSDEIAHSVTSGLSLCARVIIPSVFPFMVISDFLYTSFDFSSLKLSNTLFERLFGISRVGLYPFFLGILCGFPLGVKCVKDLYIRGDVTRDEAERLIGFCNNTGPAFLVCGVGMGLRGSFREGLLLYLIMVGSAIAVGIMFGIRNRPEGCTQSLERKSFSLTASIKDAGVNTLTVCSYLTFFACLCGLLRKLLGETMPYLALLPFIEIGSSSSILSKTHLLTNIQSFALTAFSVGFSGLSVHLQALSFIAETDIRTGKYFLMKLLQGTVSFIISVPLYKLIT